MIVFNFSRKSRKWSFNSVFSSVQRFFLIINVINSLENIRGLQLSFFMFQWFCIHSFLDINLLEPIKCSLSIWEEASVTTWIIISLIPRRPSNYKTWTLPQTNEIYHFHHHRMKIGGKVNWWKVNWWKSLTKWMRNEKLLMFHVRTKFKLFADDWLN